MAHERVELLEGAGVEQLLDPLPGGVLAPCVLLLLGLRSGVQGGLAQLVELRELFLVALRRLLAGGFAVTAARGREQGRVGLAIVWAARHGRGILSAPESPGLVQPARSGTPMSPSGLLTLSL